MKPIRLCVFCGGLPLNREHVWPDWILRHLKAKHGAANWSANYEGKVRRTNNFEDKAKCVCEKCNSTWMSRLEDRVKPILLPMIDGQVIQSLTVSQQKTLATWAFKTALVLEQHASQRLRHFPREVYRKFYIAQRAPERSSLIALAHFTDPAPALRTFSSLHDNPKMIGDTITFQIKAVILRVTAYRLTVRPPYDVESPAVRIWPEQEGPLQWPPAEGGVSHASLKEFAHRPSSAKLWEFAPDAAERLSGLSKPESELWRRW